jgi:GNAT superfamily N-acetyltransferase
MADLEILRLAQGDRVAAGQWVAVYDAVLPELALGVEDLLFLQRSRRDEREALVLDAGRAIGCAAVWRMHRDQASRTAGAWFGVVEEERRRGVGAALLALVRAEARALGLDTLQARVSEARPEAQAFLERRGFAAVARQQLVVLELDAVEPPPIELPPGIRVTTLAAEPPLEDGAFAVARVVLPEIPSPEPPRTISRERWELWLAGPHVRRDAIFVAAEADRVVAYAALSFPGGEGVHEVTAVLPDHRRRGIARALKAAQIRWAKAAGVERLRTENDSTNLPIRALNDELGYRPLPARNVLRGPVDG